MNQERIKQIELLGVKLAQYVKSENDRRFFNVFYSERKNYENFRSALIKASLWCVKQAKEPLFTLDEYLLVFEESEEVAYSDWRFARDLVLIKMIEELYRLNWFEHNNDVLATIQENDDKGE